MIFFFWMIIKASFMLFRQSSLSCVSSECFFLSVDMGERPSWSIMNAQSHLSFLFMKLVSFGELETRLLDVIFFFFFFLLDVNSPTRKKRRNRVKSVNSQKKKVKGNFGIQKSVRKKINKKIKRGGDFICRGWEFQFP